MKIDESTYELIDQYLSGHLSAVEMAKVEARIKDDQEFAEEVSWMKEFHSAMKNPRGFEILDQFQVIHARQKRKARIRKIVRAAVLLLLPLVAILLFFPFPHRPDEALTPQKSIVSKSDSLNDWEKLVEFPALGQQMLGGDEDLREQAIARYEKGDRSGALPLLEAYIAGLDPEDDDYAIRILIGKIYLSDKKDYPKAGEAFNAVLQSDAMGPFKTEARFNIALMEFAKGNREQARELFRQLSTEADETWRAKAETALKELF